jgi:hypothetical protein
LGRGRALVPGAFNFPKVTAIAVADTRVGRRGKITNDRRYYIASRALSKCPRRGGAQPLTLPIVLPNISQPRRLENAAAFRQLRSDW